MKKQNLIALSLLLALAVPAWGSAGSILKEKARGFRDVDRTGEGQPPPATAKKAEPQPKSRPATITMPKAPEIQLSASQQDSAKKLLTTLEGIEPGAAASSQQVQALIKEVLASAQGPVKPSFNSTMKLSSSLATGWSSQKMEPTDKQLFVKSLVYLLNSPGRPDRQTDKTLQHSETLLKFSGMKGTEAERIAADLKAVVAQLNK